MKCTTCGQSLSLRMTHCATCGTPASYAAKPQSISFAISPPTTPRQTSNEQYEHYTSAQLSQQRQEQRVHGIYPPTQALASAYTPMQQPLLEKNNSGQSYSMEPPAPRKKHNWRRFFLLSSVLCVLLLSSIGVYKLLRIANTTSSAKQAHTPSGNALIPVAETILKNAQTSGDIDTTLAPTQVTKTFMANQKVYVTFTITSGKQDGFIEAKWYEDGQIVATTILPHIHENTHGVFSNVYITATPDGAIELYWCTQPDCKDAQLAQVVHFVVNPVDTAYVRYQKRLTQ